MSLSSLFGGGDTVDILTGGQKRLFNSLTDLLEGQLGKPGPQYTGPGLPAVNPVMQSALSNMSIYQQDPAIQQALSTQLSGAGDPAGVRSVYEAALDPARLEFQRQLRGLGARYGDTIGQSGALPYMAAQATAEYGGGLNSLLANLTYADRQSAANRQAGAIPMALEVGNNAVGLNQQKLGMGEYARNLQAQFNQEQLAKFTGAQAYSNPWLDYLSVALGTQTKAPTTQPGLIPGITGALGGLGQAGMGLGALLAI